MKKSFFIRVEGLNAFRAFSRASFTGLLIFALVFVCSCASSGGAGKSPDDLSGIYAGVIPAADCPGISVVLILNAETGNYKMTYQYIDRDVPVSTFAGTFSHDRAARMITLGGGDIPRYYRIKRRGLTQLDIEGKEINGPLAKNYELGKVRF